MNEDDFQVTKGFKSYVSKPEITELTPDYLVRTSKNVLVDYASRVIGRMGYILYNQKNTGGGPILSSFDWHTSSEQEFMIRVHDGTIEFDWNGTFNILKTGFATSEIEFVPIWDNTEKIDMLLGALGDTNLYRWSGAVSKIRSSTSTTLTKQGVLTAVNTIAFVPGTLGSIAATITDLNSQFLNAGFAAGDTLFVENSVSNNRNFTIASVTAGVITLVMSDVLVAEAAGASLTIHNGEPTWATARFRTNSTRSIRYMGVDYTYDGGEGTDTLTGFSGFPIASVGDPCWQSMDILTNPDAISSENPNFKQDLISVQLNQLIMEDSKSRDVFISDSTDYTNFTVQIPRPPGTPAYVTIDDTPPCSGIPIDNSAQTISSLMLPAGRGEFFQLSFKLSADQTNENARIIKLKTATGSGVFGRGAITSVKGAVAYISHEPVLDTIGNIETVDGKKNVPLSDPVKDDFDSYDFTGTHIKYWKRMLLITVPKHGIVLIYDLMRSLWQPPQTIPVGRLSIIGDELYGHSSITNETYKLFTGTNDNGNAIPFVARFAYNNGGRRDRIKNLSEYWTDGYISGSGVLARTIYFGFDGILGKRVTSISGKDTSVVNSSDSSPIGSEPLGEVPLGGASLGSSGAPYGMRRFFQIDTIDVIDYTEHFVEYSMNTVDGQFAIVAHGCDQWDAGVSPVSHKK